MAPWASLLLLAWLVGATALTPSPVQACEAGSDDPPKARTKGR